MSNYLATKEMEPIPRTGEYNFLIALLDTHKDSKWFNTYYLEKVYGLNRNTATRQINKLTKKRFLVERDASKGLRLSKEYRLGNNPALVMYIKDRIDQYRIHHNLAPMPLEDYPSDFQSVVRTIEQWAISLNEFLKRKDVVDTLQGFTKTLQGFAKTVNEYIGSVSSRLSNFYNVND